MLGLDYSGGRPSGAAVHAAGYGFVARYLPNGLVSARVNLSAAEVADMHGAGVAVVMVWESQASRATAGRAAGIEDATYAMAQANVVGLPGLPIYFAVDFDLPDYSPAATSPVAKLGPVGEYFGGVASVLGLARTGVYGGYWAVRRCLDAGLARYAWQTAAWSGGNVDTRIHLFQRLGTASVDGVACDVNEARQTDFGQNAEDNMALSDDQFTELKAWLVMLACTNGEKLPDNWQTRYVWPNGGDGTNRQNELKAAVQPALDAIAAVNAKVTALATGGVDLDALAAKVAALIHQKPLDVILSGTATPHEGT